MSLFVICDHFDGMHGFYKWLTSATPFWFVGCTVLLVVGAGVSHAPLRWSVYFVSIVAFIMSISSVLGMDYVFSHFQNTGLLFGMSFILILAMFLPLVLTGVLVGSSLVFSLGALGIL